MAPDLKRRRSRPSHWWEATPAPIVIGETVNPAPTVISRVEELENEARGTTDQSKETTGGNGSSRKEEIRRRRSARLSNVHGQGEAEVVETVTAVASLGNGKTAKKKGGPSTTGMAKKVMDLGITEGEIGAKNRGSKGKKGVQVEPAEEGLETVAQHKRRGRPAQKSVEMEDEAAEEDAEPVVRRRGRPSLSKEAEMEGEKPSEPEQKRRGRPTRKENEAQDLAEDEVVIRRHGRPAHQEPNEFEDLPEASSTPKPKKRGRRSNTEIEASTIIPPALDAEPKKRGRRPVNKEPELEVEELPASEPRKRAKRSNKEAEDMHTQDPAPKKRGRPADKENQDPQIDSTTSKRRGRRSNTDIEEPAAPASQSKDPLRQKRKKPVEVVDEAISSAKEQAARKFSQIPGVLADSTNQQFRPRKRSRTEKVQESHHEKRKRGQPSEADMAGPSQSKGKAGRHSNTELNKRKQRETEEAAQQPKRRRLDSSPDRTSKHVDKPPSYQFLAVKTHRVSRQTIDTKWDPLPAPAVDRITQLFTDIQRPTLLRINDERKKEQASTAMRQIIKNITSKISRGLPFPQGARNHREDDFDFEKILDHNRALESQLTPILHANELLEAELEKEKALLDSEQTYLEELETNAKDQASKWKQESRKVHSLLRSEEKIKEDDLVYSIGIDADSAIPVTLDTQKDDALQAIVKDVEGHVDSIQRNLSQVEGVSEAIAKGKAAVQATLFDHLEPERYEGIVLG